jgi:hypothetical protein
MLTIESRETTLQRSERGKAEILLDMAVGKVPRKVRTFVELHAYVDANEYGGLCDGTDFKDDDGTEMLRVGIIVQEELHKWLARGGHRYVSDADPQEQLVAAVEAALLAYDMETDEEHPGGSGEHDCVRCLIGMPIGYDLEDDEPTLVNAIVPETCVMPQRPALGSVRIRLPRRAVGTVSP